MKVDGIELVAGDVIRINGIDLAQPPSRRNRMRMWAAQRLWKLADALGQLADRVNTVSVRQNNGAEVRVSANGDWVVTTTVTTGEWQ